MDPEKQLAIRITLHVGGRTVTTYISVEYGLRHQDVLLRIVTLVDFCLVTGGED